MACFRIWTHDPYLDHAKVILEADLLLVYNLGQQIMPNDELKAV